MEEASETCSDGKRRGGRTDAAVMMAAEAFASLPARSYFVAEAATAAEPELEPAARSRTPPRSPLRWKAHESSNN